MPPPPPRVFRGGLPHPKPTAPTLRVRLGVAGGQGGCWGAGAPMAVRLGYQWHRSLLHPNPQHWGCPWDGLCGVGTVTSATGASPGAASVPQAGAVWGCPSACKPAFACPSASSCGASVGLRPPPPYQGQAYGFWALLARMRLWDWGWCRGYPQLWSQARVQTSTTRPGSRLPVPTQQGCPEPGSAFVVPSDCCNPTLPCSPHAGSSSWTPPPA